MYDIGNVPRTVRRPDAPGMELYSDAVYGGDTNTESLYDAPEQEEDPYSAANPLADTYDMASSRDLIDTAPRMEQQYDHATPGGENPYDMGTDGSQHGGVASESAYDMADGDTKSVLPSLRVDDSLYDIAGDDYSRFGANASSSSSSTGGGKSPHGFAAANSSYAQALEGVEEGEPLEDHPSTLTGGSMYALAHANRPTGNNAPGSAKPAATQYTYTIPGGAEGDGLMYAIAQAPTEATYTRNGEDTERQTREASL